MLDAAWPSSSAIADAARARYVLQRARAILLDLDGTLIRRDGAIDGAGELLSCCGERVLILSNNSSDTEETLSARLTRMGLAIPPERLVLAGTRAIDVIAGRWPGARVLLIASPAIRAAAERAGLIPVSERPDIVMVARSTSFDYAALARAANAVRDGAVFLVTNPDMTHPGPNGAVVPETGAIAAAIAAAGGRDPDLVVGKPEPGFFRAALDRLGLAAAEAVMIGDNPATDGVGAGQLGMPHIIVGAALPLRALVGPAAPATWPTARYVSSR